METTLQILVTFVGLFNLIYGLGCTIAALRPKNQGAGFALNCLFAALTLTISTECALWWVHQV